MRARLTDSPERLRLGNRPVPGVVDVPDGETFEALVAERSTSGR